MYHVDNVSITGFWGKFSLTFLLYEDVNILIGANGSGKTTFMDILLAALQLDLAALDEQTFDQIDILLRSGKKQRKLSITKHSSEEQAYDKLSIKIGKGKTRSVFLTPNNVDRRRLARDSFYGRKMSDYWDAKDNLAELINLSSLSVHRISNDLFDFDMENDVRRVSNRNRISSKPIVDYRLEQLSQKLAIYQLELAENEKEVSDTFQKKVLASVLYNPEFDKLQVGSLPNKADVDEQKTQLQKAYRELGASGKSIRKNITAHFESIERSINLIRQLPKLGSDFSVDDLLPIPLLRRTQHIIELSLHAENAKKIIAEPITKFLEIASSFIKDKDLSIDRNSGSLIIKKNDQSLPLMSLSSGEKQLLILLIEALLQRNKPYVFLADEPEISLHIEWQEKIIQSIRKLNKFSQVIVATHSPEIAGGWQNNIFQIGKHIND